MKYCLQWDDGSEAVIVNTKAEVEEMLQEWLNDGETDTNIWHVSEMKDLKFEIIPGRVKVG